VVTDEELGGAVVHGSKSGVTHFIADDEREGILLIRKLMSYLPQNNLEEAPILPCHDPIDRLEDALNEIIPDNPNKPYDVKDVIHAITDNHEFFEVHRNYAQNIVVGFARFNGISVGIVANQPAYLAGVLDINASRKAARFVRFCDAFNIPLVTLEDVPGFCPVQLRNMEVLLFMVPNYFMLMARPPYPKLLLSSVKLMVVLTAL
jgi:methylmalonyl-CoA decarboxylase subunit alpha